MYNLNITRFSPSERRVYTKLVLTRASFPKENLAELTKVSVPFFPFSVESEKKVRVYEVNSESSRSERHDL